MPKSYCPANGTEGDMFTEKFCERCKKDANGDCEILLDSMLYKVDDPRYPREWIYDERGNPTCTAFEPILQNTYRWT